MTDISKEEAEFIATRHLAGTRYVHGDFEGIVREIRFGEHRTTFKLETIRICENGGPELLSFRATFGVAICDLRGWCAEHHGCPQGEIALWCDE